MVSSKMEPTTFYVFIRREYPLAPAIDYYPIAGRYDFGWAGCIRSDFAAGSLAYFGPGLSFVAGSDIPGSGSAGYPAGFHCSADCPGPCHRR